MNIYEEQKQSVRQTDQKKTWKSEICFLLTILIVFTTSYILRFSNDFWRAHHILSPISFSFSVTDLFTPIIFDIIPVSLILYIHSRNFKAVH